MIVQYNSEFGLLPNVFLRERTKKDIERFFPIIERTVKLAKEAISKSYDPLRSQAEKIFNDLIKKYEYIKEIHSQNKYSMVGTDSPEDVLVRIQKLSEEFSMLYNDIISALKGKESEDVILKKLKAKEIAIKKVEQKRKVEFFDISNLIKWAVVGIGIVYLAPIVMRILPRRD